MKTVYLVRHGETNANANSLVQGGTETLSEQGLKQAAVLAERLRHIPFSNLLVSDYVRTRQTVAPLLAYTTVEPVYTELVRETKRPSPFLGFPTEGADYQAFLTAADEHSTDPLWHFADEENFFDILARVNAFFAHLNTLEGDTVVVSHGRFIIFILMQTLMNGQLTPDVWSRTKYQFISHNTGITVLKFQDKHQNWALTTFNDIAHFAE